MTEFELIARYFDRPLVRGRARRARLGIGDDCALLTPRFDHDLAVSTDMLVAGRHFFEDTDPVSLGWKTLAVNLSDLAAMGARPLGFTLALALPAIDEAWLSSFSEGLFACADQFDCELIGGDTTRGPLNLCVTIFGEVASGHGLRRDAAMVGDDIWVSGEIGNAALALQRLARQREGVEQAIDRDLRSVLERPVPRVALGLALRELAHAAIDVSDGLAQDLGHVLAASRRGAELNVESLPIGRELSTIDEEQRLRFALAGGDDYELCFTAPPARRDDVERAALASSTRVTRIGVVIDGSALRLVDAQGADWRAVDPTSGLAPFGGFDHFA
jgi:thiamine-monophosphate kinase